MIQSIVHFVSFLKSIELEKNATKTASLFRPVWRKKKSLLVMLYTTLALNICINALFRPGKEQAKTLPSKWKKNAPCPAAWNPIPSAETGTSGWRGDFHEIRASSTFYTCCWCCYTGLGWSQKQNLWFPGRLGNVVPESSFLLFFSRDTLLSSVTMPMGLTRYVNKQCILISCLFTNRATSFGIVELDFAFLWKL